MDQYIISARKYRPTSFDKVVGQDHITSTLENAIKNNRISHAYLFSGPRGVGKTSCARIFAKMINSNHKNDNSFNVFELDAASNNTVEDIRNLIQKIRIPPQNCKYKTYIIDEVHMLTSSAFNAFLKTLEEPPKHAIFILATTEKNKIIPTILSRCQIFDFKKILVKDIIESLKKLLETKKIKYDDESLMLIAKKSDGSLRDAYTILDQIINLNDTEIKYDQVVKSLSIIDFDFYNKIINLITQDNISESIILLNDLFNQGFSSEDFIMGLLEYFRNLLMTKHEKTIELINYSEKNKTELIEQSKILDHEKTLTCIKILNEFYFKISKSLNKQFLAELCLLELSQSMNAKKKTEKSKIEKKETISIKTKTKTEKSKVEKKEKTNTIITTNPEKEINFARHTLDINAILDNKKEKIEEEGSKKEININVIWTDFLNNIKNTDNSNYQILKDIDPKIENYTIIIKINKEQRDIIKEEAAINKEIKKINKKLNLKFLIKKEIEQTKIITLEEKYNKLLKLNPNIKKLEKKLKIKFKP